MGSSGAPPTDATAWLVNIGEAAYGTLSADPDMALLDDGTAVAWYFGGLMDIHQGLLHAFAQM